MSAYMTAMREASREDVLKELARRLDEKAVLTAERDEARAELRRCDALFEKLLRRAESAEASLATGLVGWRAEIRREVLEEAAKVAKGAWLTCPYGEIADADAMCALSEHTEAAILALRDKEPPPANRGDE